MDPRWVTDLRDQCLRECVTFFFKQWGGTNKKAAGRTLEGRIWDEFPRARRPDPDPAETTAGAEQELAS